METYYNHSKPSAQMNPERSWDEATTAAQFGQPCTSVIFSLLTIPQAQYLPWHPELCCSKMATAI